MRNRDNSQQLELSDPAVRDFTAACALTPDVVRVRLLGSSRRQLLTTIEVLRAIYRDRLEMEAPHIGKRGSWIASGVIQP